MIDPDGTGTMSAKHLITMAATSTCRRPRLALYSHDTMGIGHMRRNMLIAQALSAAPVSATTLLISGAREASAFTLPSNVDCLTLPSFWKTNAGSYQSRSLLVSLPELIELRTQTLASALHAFAPDVLIVDKEPRGALGELDQALARLKSRGRTRFVLGLRDVLDDPSTVQREWLTLANQEAVRKYYDAVWVYGDPEVYDVVDECGLTNALSNKVSFTGYLDSRERLTVPSAGKELRTVMDSPPQPYVLCMVGGGQDGAELAMAFASANLPRGRHGVIITGPCMPNNIKNQLQQQTSVDSRWHIFEFHPEPCRLLANAERVVAMGGYNTVTEILAFEKPALIVPRVSPRQEQLIRAVRMQQLGLLDVLHPEQLNARAISQWLAQLRPSSTNARQKVDFDGLNRLPGMLQSLLTTKKSTFPTRTTEVRHAVL